MTQDSNIHVKDGLIDFVAGSLGGIALVYVGQPLDTVKVKMQTYPKIYRSMVDCFKKTLRHDGICKGLYAGTAPALVANITENSVLFLCYGFCQKLIQTVTNANSVSELSTMGNASAGFIASFFTSFTICPTELVKCRLQAAYEHHKKVKEQGVILERIGPVRMVELIIREEGTAGLFRGLVPTLAREMPGYFFFFGGYEGARQILCAPGQCKEDIGLLRTMIAGSVGGLLFWTLTYPADVVKSRIQVQNTNENMFTMLLKISKREGIGALYNGLSPTLVRTIPATATLFVTYEYSKKFLRQEF